MLPFHCKSKPLLSTFSKCNEINSYNQEVLQDMGSQCLNTPW